MKISIQMLPKNVWIITANSWKRYRVCLGNVESSDKHWLDVCHVSVWWHAIPLDNTQHIWSVSSIHKSLECLSSLIHFIFKTAHPCGVSVQGCQLVRLSEIYFDDCTIDFPFIYSLLEGILQRYGMATSQSSSFHPISSLISQNEPQSSAPPALFGCPPRHAL